jgi:ribonucleoside-diphosphate reductase beta chain
MATLLDLTSQGDVATISDESKLSSITLMTPQQLYELWERQNWLSSEIDLTQDRTDWLERVDPEERDQLSWFLSSFFIGEERVTTQFSGLVMAYESQSEEAFLATQQVDEARHAQHFNRFYEQVLGYDGTFESRLERAREDLNDAFKIMFDENLVEAGNRLIADPSDVEAKVDFIVTYHMLIEGVLALTGQYFLTNFLEERGILPGFVEGFKLISQDEHRHVAYGTWYLKEAAQDPALAQRIQDRLIELLPTTALVFVPPGIDPTEDWAMLGYTSDEVNQFAFTALTRRLKVIGVGLPAVAAS